MPQQSLFKEMFLRNTEVVQPYPDISTITLGLFSDQSLDEDSFGQVLVQRLLPYFSQRQRCVARDDLFNIGPLKFKVMACFPAGGLVNAGTQVQCYTALQTHALTRVHLFPVRPSTLSEQSFRRKVLPYMKEHTLHLHKEQTLTISGIKLIVVAIEPPNGIVTGSTELFFTGDPLPEIRQITIRPHAENLPSPLRNLSQDQLKDALYHMFLMPFFVGWSRVIEANQMLDIEGVRMTVQSSQAGFGIISDSSRILFDGSVISRSVPDLISQRLRSFLGGRSGAVRSSGDPRIDLIQHILFIQQILSSIDLGGEEAGTANEVMAQLPTYRLTCVPSCEDRKRCMICMEDYAVGDEVKTLPCCKG
jgi:hypothetical protein